jgi:glycine oxidase
MSDLLVIGGGVVGLSIAYEAAGRGLNVRLIDAREPGREASWAGAGILPPAGEHSSNPREQLTALSNRLHRVWAEELKSATGIDNGYRPCGAFYIAREESTRDELGRMHAWAAAEGVAIEPIPYAELTRVEPALQPTGGPVDAALVPGECQIRNPRHLKALIQSCQQRGVEIIGNAAAEEFDVRKNRISEVRSGQNRYIADQYCLCTGSWTSDLARKLQLRLAIKPIRGQIALLKCDQPLFTHIVNEGKRYLVPRPDGRVIVGSTEEDAGFDHSTLEESIADLRDFAASLVPRLAEMPLETCWAGLRPASRDGLPYLGRAPQLENAFVAAGHFRSGLQLSPGTAVVMNDLLAGIRPTIDLNLFRPDRHAGAEAWAMS